MARSNTECEILAYCLRRNIADEAVTKEGEETMRVSHRHNILSLQDLTNHLLLWGLHTEIALEPEIFCAAVLPEQFFVPPSTAHAGASELGLMRAVMEDAVRCYQKQFVPGPRRNHALAQEATRWFFDDDTTWPFSFLNLCVALSLDPTYIRRRLRHWRETRPIMVLPRKTRVVSSQRKMRLAA